MGTKKPFAMQAHLFFTLGWLALWSITLQAQLNDRELKLAYVEQHKLLAVNEMERSGVPASIKLGQGLLESRWGTSDLARQAHNHFGIKCGPFWTGPSYYKKDDDTDAQGNLINSCFRSYPNTEASFMDHSNFLRDPRKVDRYGFLFTLPRTNYRAWAEGLKKAGYATDAGYHTKLIRIIEELELNQYDSLSTAQVIASMGTIPTGGLPMVRPPQVLPSSEIQVVNDVKYVYAGVKQTLRDVATRHSVPIKTLLQHNENLTSPDQPLATGSRVFLQPKRKKYRGRTTEHLVRKGETLADIANLYGVALAALQHRNHLAPGQEPAAGEKVKLRGRQKATLQLVAPAPQPQPAPAATPPSPAIVARPAPDTSAAPSGSPELASGIAAPQYYRIIAQENLESIAKKFQTTVEVLRYLNGLKANNAIRAGMVIRIR